MRVRVGGLSDRGRSLGRGTFKLSPQGSVNYTAGGGGDSPLESPGREGGRWVLGAERSPAGTRADEEQGGARHKACAAVRGDQVTQRPAAWVRRFLLF